MHKTSPYPEVADVEVDGDNNTSCHHYCALTTFQPHLQVLVLVISLTAEDMIPILQVRLREVNFPTVTEVVRVGIQTQSGSCLNTV